MYLYLIVLWAFVGWRCGNEPRPFPRLPDPVIPPKPEPVCPVCGRVLGALAGILGGWAFTQVFLPQDPDPLRSPLFAAATAVGAFAVAGVATDVYGLVSRRGR
jgi:hypothetical protein